MDWSKAKTILIVALLITNIFLAYFLYGEQEVGNAVLNPEFIEETEELLGRNGILLQSDLPTETGQLYNLTVEYEDMLPGTINDRFFNSEGVINRNEGAVIEIDYGDEGITLINEKLMIYENAATEAGNPIGNLEQAMELAKQFLMERGYETDDMGLSYWRETENGYYLDFTKIFQDSYIELSYTVVIIEDGKDGKDLAKHQGN